MAQGSMQSLGESMSDRLTMTQFDLLCNFTDGFPCIGELTEAEQDELFRRRVIELQANPPAWLLEAEAEWEKQQQGEGR